MNKLEDLATTAEQLASKVLDTYRGKGQPKIQIEMASLLRALARKLAEERDKLKAELKQGQEKLTIMSERASVAEAELEQMHLRPRQNMDPFYSLVPIDDNMEKAASYMSGLKLLRDTYNVSFGETGSNDARLSKLEAKVESLIFIRDR